MADEYDGPATAVLPDGTRIPGRLTAREFPSGGLKDWDGIFEVDDLGDAPRLVDGDDGFTIETEAGSGPVLPRGSVDETTLDIRGAGGRPPWKGTR